MSGRWYGRPVGAACAAIAVLSVSLSVLSRARFGPTESGSRMAVAVTIRHHGVDPLEMERSVAVPLEDALASIPGAVETSSSSEFGKARALVRFAHGSSAESTYECAREAAYRVYARLPSSAQRPEIASTSEGRGPVWIAAVYSERASGAALGRLLERSVKPSLEKLKGAGDVELAGVGSPELIVAVDERAAAAAGASIGGVARALARSDAFAPAGSLSARGVRAPIFADGRYASEEDVREALVPTVPGEALTLGSLAAVTGAHRKPEALARVDGRSAVTVAVYPGGGANLPELSRAIKRETAALSAEYGVRFLTLADSGADVARSFSSAAAAAVQGALAVAAACALLLGRGGRAGPGPVARRARLTAVASVPAILVVSAAALTAMGYGLDRHALAGLAVGLGTSVDTAIIAALRLGRAESPSAGNAAMRELSPALASGTATTLVVLIPLARLEFMSEGVSTVAAAIATACVCSYLAAVLLLPPLALGATRDDRPTSLEARSRSDRRAFLKALGRKALRLLAKNAVLCSGRPHIPLSLAAALSAGGLVALALIPVDTTGDYDGNGIFAHVEFEPGAAVEGVDERLGSCATALSALPGVTHVQSTAWRGSGSLVVSFDAKKTDGAGVAGAIASLPVPGGFAWLPTPPPGERSWELVVSGEDEALCRSLAAGAARAIASLPFVIDTVLNFKEGPETITFRPDRGRQAASGVAFSRAADALRLSIQGPVAYKRVDEAGETDVRATALRPGEPRVSDALGTLVPTASGAVRLGSLMSLGRERDAARIDRLDRRRVARLTIRSKPLDPRKAEAAVSGALEGAALPPGYAVEFDRDAVAAAESLRGTGLSFVVAAALAYMVLAAVGESFGAPLAVLSALPPSLAVPALLHAASGSSLGPAEACAFVAVSGLVVNASVLTVEECRSLGRFSRASPRALYRVVRSRLGALVATSGTSVAGALPFLFLPDSGSAMVRSLAFVAATGTAASFLVALTVVPALASAAPRLFHSFSPSHARSKEGSSL